MWCGTNVNDCADQVCIPRVGNKVILEPDHVVKIHAITQWCGTCGMGLHDNETCPECSDQAMSGEPKDMCQECWHPRSYHRGGNCVHEGYGDEENSMRWLRCHCEGFAALAPSEPAGPEGWREAEGAAPRRVGDDMSPEEAIRISRGHAPSEPVQAEPVEREDQAGYWDGFKDASELAVKVIAKVDKTHLAAEGDGFTIHTGRDNLRQDVEAIFRDTDYFDFGEAINAVIELLQDHYRFAPSEPEVTVKDLEELGAIHVPHKAMSDRKVAPRARKVATQENS